MNDNIVPLRAPYRHPMYETLAALDAAISSAAIGDPVAANWLRQMAGIVRQMGAELQQASGDAERWRASAAHLAAQKAPMEALAIFAGGCRDALARLAQQAEAADRETIDLEALKAGTGLLVASVENLIALTEALALGYENMRGRLVTRLGA